MTTTSRKRPGSEKAEKTDREEKIEKEEKAENPPIGIILCSDKNESMVRYTLLENNQKVFASKYKLYLPTEKQLKDEIAKERAQIEMERKFAGRKNG